MATVRYKNNIMSYLQRVPEELPIITKDVAIFMAREAKIPYDRAKKAVNVNLSRLERQGILSRVARGIYCKRIKTIFGDYVPSKDNIYSRWLTLDGDAVIGYETGLSLMNHMGLTSQMPRKKYIATNKYTTAIPADVEIEVKKPVTPVTQGNYRYLQILDVINEMERAPVDALHPELLIRQKVEEANLERDRLIVYARQLYPVKTLELAVDVILGDVTI